MRPHLTSCRYRQRCPGYTLLELLVVLAILGFLAVWAHQARPSRVGEALVALRSQVLQARFEAIERNEAVAVVYGSAQRSFRTLATGELGLPDGCESGEVLRTVDLADFPGVAMAGGLERGLVWLPSGSGRTCSGGGVFNQTITLKDAVREGRVIVSRAGRVRSELEL